MTRKPTALLTISILFFTCFTIPVSAFYFDFQYFETDKLVYEVGETIDMVAKLTADFSDEGWCYASFAIVTDTGPSFADEYFIPPSPTVRYLNSSYTIMPDYTSPNETGVQAFVLFSVEIFDTVYQSAGDNIEIIINRGHLTTIPLSPLSVQYGLNTSLSLQITSIYSNNIFYANEPVTLHVKNSNSQTVFQKNTTTTSEGILQLNWSESLGSPGLYNLTVSSYGTEDFLPFSDLFQVTVLPSISNLTIISSPASVYCQSPDGEHFEQAEIIVEHTDLESRAINDSTIQWIATFGSGIMTNLGSGLYSSTIPFNTCPGLYHINFTAMNSQFQTANTTTVIDVLPNQIQFSSIQPYWNVIRSQNITIEFLIKQYLEWNQSIELQFIAESLQFEQRFDVQPNVPSFVTIPIWHSISVGHHTVYISHLNEYYQFVVSPEINILVTGTMTANVSDEIAFYDETLEFNLGLLDDNNQTVYLANVTIFCDNLSIPFTITDIINSSTPQAILLPPWISPGLHNITFIISSQFFNTINISISIRVWMRTNITIVITTSDNNSFTKCSINEESQDYDITERISSGSTMSPPPILYNGTTSTIPFTTRSTSLDN
ncbi:MAG: hypothetical protein AM326_02145 [Candidatus Thorarchaeota archaeon SMTZ-45]|nr:MAG: hypothetical protein AM326_02145 [Candidatus Thorarchaeota archaeon SMTZ-45]